ncbi:hypothetical protein GCM10009107_04560 [Ideonella azotifigens]|uniref:Secreted protein n=1 Tax=Ideonella azotifigens TaxID=513160 RepID=A0ABN1JKF8_9BURK
MPPSAVCHECSWWRYEIMRCDRLVRLVTVLVVVPACAANDANETARPNASPLAMQRRRRTGWGDTAREVFRRYICIYSRTWGDWNADMHASCRPAHSQGMSGLTGPCHPKKRDKPLTA